MDCIYISEEPLSLDDCYQKVVDNSCGGICMFIGTVRNRNKGKNVTHLDFEAYEEMALKEMEKIAIECRLTFETSRVVIAHRSGIVAISEIAVIIAVSTVHRASAFEACQYCIDALKEKVPIWKKEHLEDGSYWVGARP